MVVYQVNVYLRGIKKKKDCVVLTFQNSDESLKIMTTVDANDASKYAYGDKATIALLEGFEENNIKGTFADMSSFVGGSK